MKEKLYKSKDSLEFFYTYDYCLVCQGLKFRDVRGRDLTYIDFVVNEYESDYLSTAEFAIEFLSRFFVNPYPGKSSTDVISSLPPKLIARLFNLFCDKVFRSPPSRDVWLNNVYYLNGCSFSSLESYEDIPMTEYYQMIEIHKNRVAQEETAIKKARRNN